MIAKMKKGSMIADRGCVCPHRRMAFPEPGRQGDGPIPVGYGAIARCLRYRPEYTEP